MRATPTIGNAEKQGAFRVAFADGQSFAKNESLKPSVDLVKIPLRILQPDDSIFVPVVIRGQWR